MSQSNDTISNRDNHQQNRDSHPSILDKIADKLGIHSSHKEADHKDNKDGNSSKLDSSTGSNDHQQSTKPDQHTRTHSDIQTEEESRLFGAPSPFASHPESSDDHQKPEETNVVDSPSLTSVVDDSGNFPAVHQWPTGLRI